MHPDVGQLWQNLDRDTPAFGIVINIPTVDMGGFNGATEIWPTTHHDTQFSIHEGSTRIPESILAAKRAEGVVPYQPDVKAGSVVLRDIRLWHAGMPNPSDTPRPMIALIHWCGWWSTSDKITFRADVEPLLTHSVLKTQANYIEGDVNYLAHNSAYDFKK